MHSKIDLQVVFENGKFLVFFRKNLKKKCMVLHFHQFYNGLNVLWFYLHAFSIKVNFLVVRKLVKVAKASRFFFFAIWKAARKYWNKAPKKQPKLQPNNNFRGRAHQSLIPPQLYLIKLFGKLIKLGNFSNPMKLKFFALARGLLDDIYSCLQANKLKKFLNKKFIWKILDLFYKFSISGRYMRKGKGK